MKSLQSWPSVVDRVQPFSPILESTTNDGVRFQERQLQNGTSGLIRTDAGCVAGDSVAASTEFACDRVNYKYSSIFFNPTHKEESAMTTYTTRWRPLVAIGLVSGLIQVTAGVTMYLSGVYFAPATLRFSILMLAACIVFGTRWYGRHVLEGRTTYWSALLVGVVIGLCTGLVYVTYNIVSVSFFYPHFLQDMVQAEFARQQALGMDASQAEQVLESLRRETTLQMLVVDNLWGFTRFGIFLSALTAIAFRRRKQARTVAHARS
jgi:hypothetical protein